ncbi:MAG: globin [Planctomycetota bacterium]
MDKETSDAFQESYRRCPQKRGFLDRFYEIFLGASEEVREIFAQTDFLKQIRLLKASFLMMLQASFDDLEGQEHMEALARLHSREELGIRLGLYELWLDSLIQAVREADPRFDPQVEDAWRSTLKPGIEFMKARY